MEPMPELTSTVQDSKEIVALLEKHMQIPEGQMRSYIIIATEENPHDTSQWRFVSSTNLGGTEELIQFVSDYFMERVMMEGKIGQARKAQRETPPIE